MFSRTSMHRGRRLLLAATTLAAVAVLPLSAQQRAPAAIFLTWHSDPTTSVLVDWHFDDGVHAPVVEVRGPGLETWTAFPGQPIAFPFSNRHVQRAAVTALQPGAEYELRVGGSRVYRYRTMPAQLTRPIRFAVGGDTRASITDFGRMNRVAARRDVDFVMFGGDLAYSNGNPRLVAREQEWWETITRTLVTPDGRLIPVLPAIGNHEVFSSRNDPALDTIMREHGVRLGDAPYYSALVGTLANRSYGAIDVGDYLSLLLLDTGHRTPIAGAQTQWLAHALEERAHVPFIAPIYHVPAYPSVRTYEGPNSELVRQHWVPLFEQHNVRIAFENHDHVYKRTVPLKAGARDERGVVYMGDGAWGASPRVVGRDQGEVAAWYMAAAKPVNHGIFVTLDRTGQRLEVLDTLGHIMDEYRTTARASRPGRIRIVPTDFATLADAVAAATPGDTVLLEPGVHRAGVLLERRDLTIASRFLTTGDTTFIRRTVLDGDSGAFVLRITGTAPRPLRVVGVTLRNAEDCIYAQGRFHLVRAVITGCVDGIDYDRESGGTVDASLFELNRDDGIDLDQDVEVDIRGSIIRDNRQDGIEIRLHPHSGQLVTARIANNVISGNGQDGIQFIDYDGIANRMYRIEANRFVDNRMAGIGCLDRAQTAQDYRAAAVHEPIMLRDNAFHGNAREISCRFDTDTAVGSPRVATLDPAFTTQRDTALNFDSPAIWHGTNGEHWLLTTAKQGNIVRVNDAATGQFLRDFGKAGAAVGELRRPNGIAVVDDLMFVVERDNARVQVVRLPSLQPLGTFGAGELQLPYGIAVERRAHGGDTAYAAYVTDNFEMAAVARDSAWTRRVRRFDIGARGNELTVQNVYALGDARGAGRLQVVESIAWDPVHAQLLAAEERAGQSSVKVFTPEGRYSGEIDATFFPNQAEGIALYRCGARGGWWVTTDQGTAVNTFHVFDRATLRHAGSFRLRGVLNTDGIAVTERAFGRFRRGAFYAVNDDGNVAAVAWQTIADALSLDARCR